MARASKVEACMICEEIPCTCFKKPSKTGTKPKSSSRPTSAADSAPVSSDPAPIISPVRVNTLPDRDDQGRLIGDSSQELARALRALRPILHPDEIVKHRIGLAPKTKAESWRRRTNEST